MTKQEAKEYLNNYRKMYAELAPERFLEALNIMLNEPSLPSNLDEAAEEYCSKCREKGFHLSPWSAFKAGAEWMAGQGETIDCSIDWYDGPIPDCSEEQLFSAIEKAELEVGDKVIIQIRKK